MIRSILFPVLFVSGLAFAATPAAPAPAAPATPAATPSRPATPAPPAATPAKIPLAVFEDLDKNNDKALDKAELSALADLVRDFGIVDTDKNGKLNEAEYTAWADKQKM